MHCILHKSSGQRRQPKKKVAEKAKDRAESRRFVETVYDPSVLANILNQYQPGSLANTGAVYLWKQQVRPKEHRHVSLFPGQNGRGFHITAEHSNIKKTHWFFRNDGSYRYSQVKTNQGVVQTHQDMSKHGAVLQEAKQFAKFLQNRRS